MKITLKDYDTNREVLTSNLMFVEVCGQQVYACINKPPERLADEVEQAVYALNNNVYEGVISDGWSDNYETPTNPYIRWSFKP